MNNVRPDDLLFKKYARQIHDLLRLNAGLTDMIGERSAVISHVIDIREALEKCYRWHRTELAKYAHFFGSRTVIIFMIIKCSCKVKPFQRQNRSPTYFVVHRPLTVSLEHISV